MVVVLASLATLLLAANKKKEANVCSGVQIRILPEDDVHCVEEDDVLLTIEKRAGGTLVNRAVSALDLDAMEAAVEENDWIKDAQLYLDSRHQMHVVVAERRPVARFITTAGTSFYADEEGTRLSFIPGKPIRLQVVTGFTAAKKWNVKDSALFAQSLQVVNYISRHPFWNAQVGQIDITRQGSFELVPLLGNAVIRFGIADKVEEKFNKLYLFYAQVLRKTGFNKYAAIDVQYDGQVVAEKKGGAAAVDSLQLKRNIEEFLKQKQQQQMAEAIAENNNDTDAQETIAPATDLTIRSETESKQAEKSPSSLPAASTIIDEKPNSLPPSVPVKTKPIVQRKTPPAKAKPPAVVKKVAVATDEKQPKAVMPRRDESDQQP